MMHDFTPKVSATLFKPAGCGKARNFSKAKKKLGIRSGPQVFPGSRAATGLM